MPKGCSVHSTVPWFHELSPTLAGLWWHSCLWRISAPIINSTPIFLYVTPTKFTSAKWTLISIFWFVMSSLSGCLDICVISPHKKLSHAVMVPPISRIDFSSLVKFFWKKKHHRHTKDVISSVIHVSQVTINHHDNADQFTYLYSGFLLECLKFNF